jgi:5-methylcytosine-specific restriction endonuclease McrA
VQERARAYRCRYRQRAAVQDHERAYRHRYNHSEANREAQRRYAQTEAGRTCRRETVYRYFRNNPHKKKQGHALRRARKRKATIIESVDRMAIFHVDGGLCHLCDAAADPDHFQLDHIIPLSVEPIEASWNYGVAHPTCNYRKGARLRAHMLSATARARWQEHRPDDLARLESATMLLLRRDNRGAGPQAPCPMTRH